MGKLHRMVGQGKDGYGRARYNSTVNNRGHGADCPSVRNSKMTGLTEQIAEWLFRLEHHTDWDDYQRDHPNTSVIYPQRAQHLLRFLDSIGFVQKDDDQKMPPHISSKHLYPSSSTEAAHCDGWVDSQVEIWAAGFRRVHSILPQEKGK